MGHLNLGNILFMFHHIHGTFKFRDFDAAASNLGHILTRKGIKPQPKKVQGILMLNPPNKVKELRHFLGMVQYYRDMWAICSEMLAPLTDLVGECGKTKATKKNKNKKKPLQWDPIHQQAFDKVKAAIAKEVVLA
jgi:hypothetical protein